MGVIAMLVLLTAVLCTQLSLYSASSTTHAHRGTRHRHYWQQRATAYMALMTPRFGKVSESRATAVLSADDDGVGAEGTGTTAYVSECELPTDKGMFRLRAYRHDCAADGGLTESGTLGGSMEPVALIGGDFDKWGGENVPVRVHDQCLTSEVLGSRRCDCSEQLAMSIDYIRENGGVVIYLQQEGRGIGLANKVRAYALQDGGMDTVDANRHLGFGDDHRSYDAVGFILKDLGVRSVQLMTNNPFKAKCLKAMGIAVTGRIPMLVPPTKLNERYLRAKSNRMNHFLHQLEESELMDGMSIASLRGGDSNRLEQEQALITEEKETWAFGRQSVVDAVAAVGAGKLVVVTDDEDRENEGDLIGAADCMTPENMAFIIKHTGGVICVSLEDDRLAELELPPMVENNQDPKKTAFTVSVDSREGTTTGISAYDRSKTVRDLASLSSTPGSFNRPGHIFPLRYSPGGVLARNGHTEAALDLSRMAGRAPVGVLSEVITEDGLEMARLPDLKAFCKLHGLVLTSIKDMRVYLREQGKRPIAPFLFFSPSLLSLLLPHTTSDCL
ncbi:unnamed protein product [Chrysoparadoxa australica]